MDAINQENILKRNKKIIQQGLRDLGLVIFLLFLGVSCSDSTSSGGGGGSTPGPFGNIEVDQIETSKEVNYTDNFNYGTIQLEAGIAADFAITDMNPANDKISIDTNGVIMVAPGLAADEYSFRVAITGTGEYTGTNDVVGPYFLTITELEPTDPSLLSVEIEEIDANKEYSSINLNYGQVNVGAGLTNVTFAISNVNPPSATNQIAVSTNGVITIAEDLAVANYTFQVEVIGFAGNAGFYQATEVQTLTITTKPITIDNFTLPSRSVRRLVGYNDNTIYGRIIPNSGQDVTHAIINNPPNNPVSISLSGIITIAEGLKEGDYNFNVLVIGNGNYGGQFEVPLQFIVGRAELQDLVPFTPANSNAEFGYSTFTYGKYTPNSGVSANFRIINSTAPLNTITIDADGNITVNEGLAVGDYSFQVRIEVTTDNENIDTTEDRTLIITSKAITDNDFSLSRPNGRVISSRAETIPFGYTDTTYANINLTGSVTIAFAISNVNPPLNPPITIENNSIKIPTGLIAGPYAFQLVATGTGGYVGEIVRDLNLVVTRVGIVSSDFTITPTPTAPTLPSSLTKNFDYTDTSYGSIIPKGGQTVTYTIINNPIEISIDPAGVITVAPGLADGTYTFQVRVEGIDNYSESFTVSFQLIIAARISITANDFILAAPPRDPALQSFDYSEFTYTTVTLTGEVTADFAIFASNIPDGVIRIVKDAQGNGQIIVAAGLEPSTIPYTFRVRVTGNGRYTGMVETNPLNFIVELPSFFVNTYNIPDNVATNPPTYLWGAKDVATAEIDGMTYLFTAVQDDDALTVHKVENSNNVDIFKSFKDTSTTNTLNGARSVTTIKIGTTTYIYVAAENANSVVGYKFPDGGSAADFVQYTMVNDGGNISLRTPRDVTTAEINGKYYLFVAAFGRFTVQVFEIARSNGALTPVTKVTDRDDLKLDGVHSVTVARSGGNYYLFAGGYKDDGISAFAIDINGNNISLRNTGNISDNDVLNLDGFTDVTTIEIGGATYVLAVSSEDNGISVFLVTGNGGLSPVYNLNNSDPDFELQGIEALTTAELDGNTYVFITGSLTHNVSMFKVELPRGNFTLNKLVTITDSGTNDDGSSLTPKLNSAQGLTTATIGGDTLLFVAGADDEGISIFRVTGN